MPMEKVCEVCGDDFYVKPSHFDLRHTCSNECRHNRHSKMLEGHDYWGGHQYQNGHQAYGGFETRFKPGQLPWNTGLNRSGMSGKKLSEETKKKIAKANNKPEYIKKRQKALHKRPTRPERKVINIIADKKLPFKYVGDGELVIGTFIPDFVHDYDKKVIEVFGRAFHDPESSPFKVPWNRSVPGRIEQYGKLGYDCLILWDDELNTENVLAKINRFLGD